MGSFTVKRIAVTFTLGQGSFGTSGASTLTISSVAGQPGPRVSADIAQAGGDAKGMLSLRVYGMTLSHMNALSHVGRSLNWGQQQNLVAVSAGDDETGMSQIYQGSITVGWADFSAAPEVGFMVEALAGWWESLAPIQANSWPGNVSVDNILRTLAAQMNVNYRNYGVQTILSNPNLAGNGWDQFQAVLQAANCEGTLDQGTLIVWPKGGVRGGLIPKISAATVLVGYPRFNDNGITLKTLFNPSIVLGCQIDVESSLQAATNRWQVNTVAHNLESQREGGAWFSTMECSLPGNFVLQGGAAP